MGGGRACKAGLQGGPRNVCVYLQSVYVYSLSYTYLVTVQVPYRVQYGPNRAVL